LRKKINVWETTFASKIFHPFHNGDPVETYGDWLLKFSVSISWRVLLFFKKHNELNHYNFSLLEASEKALNTWRSFLLNDSSHPGVFEQHMLPFPGIIGEYNLPDLPPSINRYIMRSIDLDVPCTNTEAFTFAKLGRIFIFGFVKMKHPEHWRDTKTNINKGDFLKKHYKLPETIKNYIFDQARRALEAQGKMSEKQRDCIDKKYRENASQYRTSEMYKAMDQDYKLFGDEAFKHSKYFL